MLDFTSRRPSGKTCDGVSRRSFLKLGGLCVGGLTLAELNNLQGRRCIFWMIDAALKS